MHLNGDEIVEASLLRPVSEGSRASPTHEEEDVLLDTEPPSQGCQETATLPCEPLEENPKPCPPAPSVMKPRTQGNLAHTTRRTWHRSRSRHPASPNPADDPNDCILAYMADRD